MMKEFSGLPKEMSVPESLNAKVLAYAHEATRRKQLKRKLSWSFAAAAACLIAVGTLFFPAAETVKPAEVSHEELLAMADWSTLERESLDLTMEISFDNDDISNSNDIGLWI